jgi:malonyl-CoA decarboxylase
MAFDREAAFLADLLQSITDRSLKLLRRNGVDGRGERLDVPDLAKRLISSSGEASGVVLARLILERWATMTREEKLAWFAKLAAEFGPADDRVKEAVDAWRADPSPATAARLHTAAEPLRQELFRRINLAPGGTAAIVQMREALLGELDSHPDWDALDADFVHLLSSWFNRGFLMLKRIDWSSPADVLEKIIRYEAVHAIDGWDDLRLRLAPPDRRCFAFFHPQMPNDPLIFVEVALTKGVPDAIAGLLATERASLEPSEADTAVFYSISNTQKGLRGISFGNFLIKQVVEELAREMPRLKTFVTLSPVPGLAAWLDAEMAKDGGLLDGGEDKESLALLHAAGWHENEQNRAAVEPALARAAAIYLLNAKRRNGRPVDPVARFHLGNGASLERINLFADLSDNGLRQSYGVMVNYGYDQASIEKNHEAYANDGKIACSAAVRRLATAEKRPRLVAGRSVADRTNANKKDNLAS